MAARLFSRRAALALAGGGALSVASSSSPAFMQPEQKEGVPRDEKRPGKPSVSASFPKSISEITTSLASKHRVVFLTGHVDDKSSQAIIAQLLHLEHEAPGQPIHLQISSGGGKVYAGLAIHDVMQSLESPVATTCLGHCDSIAAILLAAGAPGRRCALPNSRVMVHQPTRSRGGSSKNAKELSISAAETEKSRLRLALILAERTGRPLAEIETLLDGDHYYSATEAVEMGLVDHVGGKGHFSRLVNGATASGVETADSGAKSPAR